MNPAAILAVISDLRLTVDQLQQQNQTLTKEVERLNGLAKKEK